MDNNQTKEWTFVEIMNRIFLHKKLLIITTLFITIVGTLLFGVLGNYSGKEYTSTFYLEYPSSTTQTLPDGSKFYYTEMITEENLAKVLIEKDEYKDINATALAKDISITENQEVGADKQVTSISYTISVKANYFKDEKTAKSFLKDLANVSLTNILASVKNIEHDNYISGIENVLAYDKKVDLLRSQINFLTQSYNAYINTYGDVSVDGKLLSWYKTQLENFTLVNPFSVLESDIKANGYAPKNERFANEIVLEMNSLKLEKELNTQKLAALQAEAEKLYAQSNIQVNEAIYPRIATLLERNVTIDNDLLVLEKQKAHAEGKKAAGDAFEYSQYEEMLADFETRLDEYYQQIKTFSDVYSQNVETFYKNQSKVAFVSPTVIQTVGVTSLVLVGGISLVFGFMAACCIAFLIEWIKENKKIAEVKQ